MKIGILTYHRAHNYGALLQAYATKNFLLQNGHQAEIIDYWPLYRDGMYDLFDFRGVKSGSVRGTLSTIKSIGKSLLFYKEKSARHRNFRHFIDTELICGQRRCLKGEDIPDDYDVIIYGSDQIWRYFMHPTFKGFDPVYWGDYPVASSVKKIAFSASMGIIEPGVGKDQFVCEKLKNFHALSVREKTLSTYIEKKCGTTVQHILDPIFLLERNYWADFAVKAQNLPKRYVLLYNLTGSESAVRIAQSLAKRQDASVLAISGSIKARIPGVDIKYTANPSLFVSLFKNASFVISTSFHGVAFSLLFEKFFYAVDMGKNSVRVTDLLNLLKIDDRYLRTESDLSSSRIIDYKCVSNLLAEQVKISKEYLLRSLKL